jgi:hypothetical protein
MRSLVVLTSVSVLALAGCATDRDAWEPIEPGALARANANANGAGAVRCSADEGGNLHVRAPADARVTTQPADDPTVEIEYGSADPSAYQMPRPRRPMSRSLGFIGDAPLTQAPNHGGRYDYGEHDNLIGPHRHSATSGWWQGSVFGHGGYGHGGYGHGYGYRHGYGRGY